MVDFTLTDEQKSMREMAHDFAEKEIRPVAWEYDKEGTWPQDIIEKAWELGLMNGHLPAEYGGEGIFRCQEGKVPQGMIFVPYGPPTCRLMGSETDGTGMPTSKGWEVEVEPVGVN